MLGFLNVSVTFVKKLLFSQIYNRHHIDLASQKTCKVFVLDRFSLLSDISVNMDEIDWGFKLHTTTPW